MRYAIARYSSFERDYAYRIYVTDAVKLLAGLNIRYADLFKPAEVRTADEIIGNIKNGLRKLGGA